MSARKCVNRIMDPGREFDTREKFTAAFAYYKEGLRLISEIIKVGGLNPTDMGYMKGNLEHFTERVEKLQVIIQSQKQSGKFHEEYKIAENSMGHSYKTLFGRFLDDEIEFVVIQDPNLEDFNQCTNLVRLCELLVQSCLNLNYIEIITTKNFTAQDEQKECFTQLTNDLLKHKVKLFVKYSETLNEMKITLNTGWVIKLSRGLDIYKQCENTFTFGTYDLDMRPCYKGIMNLYYSKNVKPAYDYTKEKLI